LLKAVRVPIDALKLLHVKPVSLKTKATTLPVDAMEVPVDAMEVPVNVMEVPVDSLKELIEALKVQIETVECKRDCERVGVKQRQLRGEIKRAAYLSRNLDVKL
jgi:hypothetical protein